MVLALVLPLGAGAQFVNFGTESPKVKWSTFSTKDYQLIYPRGADSLALVYGNLLQSYNIPVGISAGVVPNYCWNKPMPVVLRTFTADANGAVIWAPRRMDLFTLPDSQSSLSAIPWENMLAIHENRHVAQMQFTRQGFWGWSHYIFGQVSQLGVSSLLSEPCLMEGDAVAVETGLTNAGRGRSADFLSYFKMAFDNGDMRTWARWRFGSLKRYTPDYYRIGYMTVAGIRYLYDAPMYMAEVLDGQAYHFISSGYRALAKRHSGMKFRHTWDEIAGTFKEIWAEEDSLRAPFSEITPLTSAKKGFTVYSNPVAVRGDVVAIKASLDSPASLVKLDSTGRLRRMAAYGGAGKLAVSDTLGRIFWAETIPGVRYEMQQNSRIRYYDLDDGCVSSLTVKGRYYNPSVSPDGMVLCAVEYPATGGSAIVVMDALSGEVLDRMVSPSGLQFTEAVPADGIIWFVALREGGNCLFEVPFDGRRITGEMNLVLGPEPVSIKDLRIDEDGSLLFVSDRTGNSDAYRYSSDGLFRLTNTHYGLSSPFTKDGKLYASVLMPEGKMVSEVEAVPEAARFEDIHSYPVADCLSEQEEALAEQYKAIIDSADATVSPIRAWKKAGHFINIHSWSPAYINYDRFTATYSDYFYEIASPGAMVFFQNYHGTFSGSAGLSIHPKLSKEDAFIPGFHLRASWQAIFPVFDFALDVGDRKSRDFGIRYFTDKDSLSVVPVVRNGPYIGGYVSVSLPFNLSSGGWNRIIEPSVKIQGCNDFVNDPPMGFKTNEYGEEVLDNSFNDYTVPAVRNAPVMLAATLHGSFLRDKAPSQMRASGAGFELGYVFHPGMNSLYGQGYTCFPGFNPRHTVKIGAGARYDRFSRLTFWYEDPAPMLPRGLVKESSLELYLSMASPVMGKFSFDYAMPLLSVDFSASQYVYLRNFELVPFVDMSLLSLKETGGKALTLYSVGTDIAANFQKLIAAGTFRIGARLSWNGGSAMPFLQDNFTRKNPFRVSFIMNTAF